MLLESVLDTLEKCASRINEEFSFIQSRSPTEVEYVNFCCLLACTDHTLKVHRRLAFSDV